MPRAHHLSARWGGACLALTLTWMSHAAAHPAEAPASPLADLAKDPAGNPRVHLDRLDFPDVPGAPRYKKHLERFLKKEARRMRWGAGRQNRIEYRFEVTELVLRVEDGVLRVTCSAVGHLPGNRSARSKLTFGGEPARRTQVVHQVLEIVGRGVLTRLAELERTRRGLD